MDRVHQEVGQARLPEADLARGHEKGSAAEEAKEEALRLVWYRVHPKR